MKPCPRCLRLGEVWSTREVSATWQVCPVCAGVGDVPEDLRASEWSAAAQMAAVISVPCDRCEQGTAQHLRWRSGAGQAVEVICARCLTEILAETKSGNGEERPC